MKITNWKELRLSGFVTGLVLLAVAGSCAAYLRSGTTVVAHAISPEGKREALTLVRNGGAMTSYATTISIVGTDDLIARQLIPFGVVHVFFAADDNDGEVRLGDRRELDVKASWLSDRQLVVTYPEKARVLRQDATFESVVIHYVASK